VTSPGDQSPPSQPVRLRRGQVVTFTTVDRILGTRHEGVGVVTATPAEDGAPALVRPLADFELEVAPADITPATAATVAG
jgi:hypothetical protein